MSSYLEGIHLPNGQIGPQGGANHSAFCALAIQEFFAIFVIAIGVMVNTHHSLLSEKSQYAEFLRLMRTGFSFAILLRNGCEYVYVLVSTLLVLLQKILLRLTKFQKQRYILYHGLAKNDNSYLLVGQTYWLSNDYPANSCS